MRYLALSANRLAGDSVRSIDARLGFLSRKLLILLEIKGIFYN
jgi:hypothetical protein